MVSPAPQGSPPHRRIVPPAMPTPPSAVATGRGGSADGGAHYVPPKYAGDSTWGPLRMALLGGVIVVAGVVGFLAVRMRETPSALPPRNVAGGPSVGAGGQAELAASQGQQSDNVPRPGWVGSLELPAERATITITTLTPEDPVSQRFEEDVARPVVLASIDVNNSDGAKELSINTSGAVLEFSDGIKTQALDVMPVLETVHKNRDVWQKQLIQPYRVPAGQTLSGRLLLMPKDANPNRLQRIGLHVNGQSRLIPGHYLDADAKAQTLQAVRARPGAGS